MSKRKKSKYKNICVFCGEEFISSFPHTILCPKCKNLEIKTMKCYQCGKVFTPSKRLVYNYKLSGGTKKCFCSSTCGSYYGLDQTPMEKRLPNMQRTMLNRHGAINPSSLDWVKEKKKQTTKHNYGVEYPMQSTEYRKRQEDMYKQKTGYRNPSQNPKVKKKKEQTLYENYGVFNPLQSLEIKEKTAKTYKQKTGYDNPSKNPKVKAKKIETTRKNWGVDNPFQSEEIKQIARENANRTKRSNNGRSKEELYFEQCLLDRGYIEGKDFIIEYKSEQYPFFCDFFLIKNKIYIELNCFWTHGNHWYNKNSIQDKETIKKWKEKAITSKHYKEAINTWTIRDVNKRAIAKKHNFNYVVLWNKKDITEWFNNNMPIRKDWK